MVNVKWLIETTNIPEDCDPLIEALEKYDIEYKLGRREVWLIDDETLNEQSCTIFFGTLDAAKFLRPIAKWIPGVYYNPTAYNCQYYYPALGDLLLNRNYMMLPFGELKRQKELLYEKFGQDRAVFIRPDRGDKTFTGKLFYKEHFDKDIERVGYGQIEPHELVVVADPINLVQEWRLICAEGEIITGSSYKKDNLVGSEQGFPQEVQDIAEKAASLYNPDRVWCIDVGKTKGGRYCIVEVGCFSCAGLYACDREIIVKRVSKIAWDEWREYNEYE